jgi:hypothetical protein
MRKALLLAALTAVFATGASAPVYAQAAQNPPQEQQKADDKKEEQKDPKEEERKKKAEAYEKEVKELEKIEGAFTFYRKGKDLLLELPEDKIGKLFYVQASLQSGAAQWLQAGDPIGVFGVDAFRWDRQDDKMWIVRPNFKFRWNADDPLAVASQRSFPEAILGAYNITQQHPEKKLLLVNVTNLFYGEVFRLPEMVNMGLGGQYMLDRDKSGPERVKSFAENTVITMRLHFASQRGAEMNPLMLLLGLAGGNQLEDGRSAPIRVTYNAWYRNENSDYMPRLADPRVGYFTEDFYSLSRFLELDRTERYIMRFNLKKKDPSAAMSEPVKPIMWTIDHSVPEQYRDAVKDGVLRWNRAFEKLGYKNAIQVQDAPTDEDYDHSDGRFNVIRWTMTPDAGYAIALFRTDPFTGEVLNASITFDANMLSFAVQEHQRIAVPGAEAGARALDVLLRDNRRTTTEDFHLWASDRERMEHEVCNHLQRNGWSRHNCRHASGLANSAAFGMAAIAASGMTVNREEYAKQFIADVISHEVGHCLGLRHNFVASTHLSTKELDDDEITNQQGISASVMDYVPVNVMAILRGRGNFFTPTIGVYDEFAIRYGYADIPAATPSAEVPRLRAIASESGKPGHAFLTDEDADSWNPYAVRFDSAKDPVNYSEKMLEAAQRLRSYAITRLPAPGQSYADRTALILASITQTFRQGRLAARFVGGIESNRNFRADQAERFTLAPVAGPEQRKAIRLITRHCLSPDSFNLPESVMMNLSRDPSQETSSAWTAPLRQIISTQQTMLYAQIMAAGTLDRIIENGFKSSRNGAYTLDEHYSVVMGAVFNEVGQNRNIAPLRRDLQRFAINGLITQAGAPQGAISEDVRMLSSDVLRRLSARFAAQYENSKSLDEMTRVHLRDTRESIERFLARQHR